jgi:hypothetical protein
VALGAIGAGAAFVYAGLRGVSVLKAAQNIVRGQAPPAGSSSPSSASSAAAAAIAGGVTGALGVSPARYNATQLQALWISNGGDPAQAQNAGCHGMQESGGDPNVTSANPDGGINVGLWQLDTRGKGAGHTVAELQNPATNARITVFATSNGRDWSAWATPGC